MQQHYLHVLGSNSSVRQKKRKKRRRIMISHFEAKIAAMAVINSHAVDFEVKNTINNYNIAVL